MVVSAQQFQWDSAIVDFSTICLGCFQNRQQGYEATSPRKSSVNLQNGKVLQKLSII